MSTVYKLDAFYIIAFAIAVSVLNEAISWYLVLRTPNYKRLKADVDRRAKKVHALKEELVPLVEKKKHEKKVKSEEDMLKQVQQEMQMMNMKAGVATLVIMLAGFSTFSSMFDGRVSLRLPFEPFGFFRNITHRGIPGEDYTEAGFTLVYALAAYAVRSNMQRILGTTPPASASNNMWNMPTDAKGR
eukprot:GDKI01039883.1.p2 GENE.GDKI01039883.1~~GDKI01039883.1.p2  ORF type:complete len:187 (-),score=82.64 GDKI01039883.1:54-614(-)